MRQHRDHGRGRRAAARIRDAGGSAVAAAHAQIEAAFAPPLWHTIFKERVAALLRAGAAHPDVWSRYHGLAERYPDANLDTAIILVERLREAEREARASAIRIWGRCSRPRLTIMVLDELRLILRMVRRFAPARYPALAAAMRAAAPGGPQIAFAAEAAE